MKLVEILAREFKEWRYQWISLRQKTDGSIWAKISFELEEVVCLDVPLCDDAELAIVTRAQWEAERARILAESSKFTEQDKEHIADLTAIACGKRSKEDLALWDKCFLESQSMIFENAIDMETLADIAYRVAAWADAFMAERAKRMKG